MKMGEANRSSTFCTGCCSVDAADSCIEGPATGVLARGMTGDATRDGLCSVTGDAYGEYGVETAGILIFGAGTGVVTEVGGWTAAW